MRVFKVGNYGSSLSEFKKSMETVEFNESSRFVVLQLDKKKVEITLEHLAEAIIFYASASATPKSLKRAKAMRNILNQLRGSREIKVEKAIQDLKDRVRTTNGRLFQCWYM